MVGFGRFLGNYFELFLRRAFWTASRAKYEGLREDMGEYQRQSSRRAQRLRGH